MAFFGSSWLDDEEEEDDGPMAFPSLRESLKERKKEEEDDGTMKHFQD
jgi:hypothetical protein